MIVGDSRPEELLPAAARWAKGKRQPMKPLGSAGSALFAAKDGTAWLSWAGAKS